MILFLDFDGVTHPEPYDQDAAFQQLPFIEAVVRDMVGVEIVVSSSWRESHSLEELREFFFTGHSTPCSWCHTGYLESGATAAFPARERVHGLAGCKSSSRHALAGN